MLDWIEHVRRHRLLDRKTIRTPDRNPVQRRSNNRSIGETGQSLQHRLPGRLSITADHCRSKRLADGNQKALAKVILAPCFAFQLRNRRGTLLAGSILCGSQLVPVGNGDFGRDSVTVCLVLENETMTNEQLKVLSLQPWYGGSHRRFADGWTNRSQHDWTTIGLPDCNWKWRMRHASIEFARQIAERSANGESWDIIVCTDMMNAAELRSLAKPIRDLPLLVYFHENQFAYPIRGKQQPDHHFLFTNFVSALSADEVWFNSRFNLESMLSGLREHAESWPDFAPRSQIESIAPKSKIVPPPISFPADDVEQMFADRKTRVESDQPLHLVWAARWEYDKNPDALLNCLELLAQQRVPFRLSVIGENSGMPPASFQAIHRKFETQIENWGYQVSREAYWSVLKSADVFLSTATHEFFGLSVAEAIAVGAWPLLPNRLAYPELLDCQEVPQRVEQFTYPLAAKQLASQVRTLHNDRSWNFEALAALTRSVRNRFGFDSRAMTMDRMLIEFAK